MSAPPIALDAADPSCQLEVATERRRRLLEVPEVVLHEAQDAQRGRLGAQVAVALGDRQRLHGVLERNLEAPRVRLGTRELDEQLAGDEVDAVGIRRDPLLQRARSPRPSPRSRSATNPAPATADAGPGP